MNSGVFGAGCMSIPAIRKNGPVRMNVFGRGRRTRTFECRNQNPVP
jgi:hypothetical protein